MSKVFGKVSLSNYISLTTQQKASIFKPWRVFHAMTFGPGSCPGVGLAVKLQDILKCDFYKCVLEQTYTDSLLVMAPPFDSTL